MATGRGYYDILGLDKSTSEQDIQRAYRKLSKKYRPDINKAPDAKEKFKEVNEAYEVLHDKQKRAQYDQFGQAGINGQAGYGAGSGQYGGFSNFSGFGDVFSDIFGGASQRHVDPTTPVKGGGLGYTMTIDFMDAIKGKTSNITYTRSETCEVCRGTGAEKGTHPITCDKCHGNGYMTVTQQSMLGVIQRQTLCDKCHGKGVIIEHPCATCHGAGHTDKKQTLEVKIPAGIDNGQQIRLSGRGEAGKSSGPCGDLYIVFRIRPSKDFTRRGNTICTAIPISFAQATLGDEIKIKTVNDETSLKIPAGTQPGAKFTIRGEGMPYLRGDGKGDRISTVEVVIPKSINDKQKQTLVDFVKAGGDSITPQEKNFFERLKSKLD